MRDSEITGFSELKHFNDSELPASLRISRKERKTDASSRTLRFGRSVWLTVVDTSSVNFPYITARISRDGKGHLPILISECILETIISKHS